MDWVGLGWVGVGLRTWNLRDRGESCKAVMGGGWLLDADGAGGEITSWIEEGAMQCQCSRYVYLYLGYVIDENIQPLQLFFFRYQ